MTGRPPAAPAAQRVAFVVGTTAGGTGAHVRGLAAGLAARGVEVCVFGPASTAELFGPELPVTPIDIADRPRPSRDIAAVARLRALLRERRPALVHAHGLRAGALTAIALRTLGPGGTATSAVGAAAPGRRLGRPAFVVTVHNAPPAGGRAAVAVYEILERIVARTAGRVLCVSGDLADRMRRRGARSVGLAVVPAPPLPRVSAETRGAVRAALEATARPLVLAAGRLAAQKGFGTLLDAVALLGAHDGGPLVAVAGDGPLRAQLGARIDAERLPVRFLGRRDDIPALLASADVFVLPSIWEGQPLILQEALAAGAPIVASRAGGIPALTGDDAALLVPPGDPQALAAAISRVLDDPGLASRLREAAAERARSLPDENDAVEAALADYRRVGYRPVLP